MDFKEPVVGIYCNSLPVKSLILPSSNNMRSIEITEADAGQRLDRYLRKYLPSAPLASIYKLARTGKIKIDGKRVDNEYRVEAGEQLSLYLTDEQF